MTINRFYNDPVSRVFDAANHAVLILIGLVTLYPFVYVLSISLSSFRAYMLNPLMFFPREVTFSAYEKILSYPTLGNAYRVTVIVTLLGTATNMLLTITMAYPLSKGRLKGVSTVLVLVIFAMIFKPNLIPKYLVVRNLGLLDTLWALFLPTAIAPFNLILMKNFFKTIPDSMEESAFIDGASEWTVLARIIVPLSKPAIATISLFYAVFHWNNFFSAVVYIRSMDKWPLQLLLREVVMESNTESVIGGGAMADMDVVDIMPFTIQMATVVVATLPILFVYPFIQKHFIKGALLGAVKE
jgi:putative aldouronate transport system permease protein